jgi:hypothetical protein
MQGYLNVVFTCISWVSYDVKHIFIYCLCVLQKNVNSNSLAIFSCDIFLLFAVRVLHFYFVGISPLWDTWFANIFINIVDSFHFLNSTTYITKLSNFDAVQFINELFNLMDFVNFVRLLASLFYFGNQEVWSQICDFI